MLPRRIATSLFPLFLLPLLVAPVVEARELPFGPATNLRTAFDGASAVAVGDLDADGFADVVACAELAGTCAVSYQLGGGGWTHAIVASGLDSPYAVAIGDLDGDGDADLVIGQYANIPLGTPPYRAEDAELLWARNPKHGGGGWQLFPITYFVYSGTREIVLGDFDGDGDLDVAVTLVGGGSGGWDQIEVFLNDGTPEDGGWESRYVSSLGAVREPWGLAAADVDGDGDLDLVAANRIDGKVRWYENDGLASHNWPVHVIATLDGATAVAAGDLNGDGRVDVVATSASANRVVWYEQRGGATWTAHTVSTATAGACSVYLHDLDLDGDLDLLVAAAWANAVYWFENPRLPGSWNRRTIATGMTEVVAAAAADLDRDGDPDVVAVAWEGDRVTWWENRLIHRSFLASAPVDIRTGLGDPRAIAAGDLNGDGRLDIVEAEWDGDRIVAYLNAGDGLWWQSTVATGFGGARHVAVADLNGDGHLDVIGAAVDDDVIRWWENDGGVLPSWTPHTVVTGFDGAHRVAVADFDRDGDLDLVALAFNSGRIDLFTNTNGLGTAWSRKLMAILPGAFDVVVADFNRDGRPDFAVSAYTASTVHAYLNGVGAGGSWADVTVKADAAGPRGIDAADFDKDGDIDLVFVQRDNDRILWYANDGTGTSWTERTVGTGTLNDGAAVLAVDLDDDGDADVVATSQEDGDVVVWRNGGNGSTWVATDVVQSLGWAWDVVAGDFSGNGLTDLVVAAGGSADRLVWYRDVGAQAGTLAWAWAPTSIPNGQRRAAFYLVLSHRGRVGRDAAAELAVMSLYFTDTAGAPLTSAQANAIVSDVWLWQDTDRDMVLTGADTLVAHVPTLTLGPEGWLDIWIPDGAAAAAIAPTVSWGYFVEVGVTANASTQVPNQIRISIPDETTRQCFVIQLEDRDHDLVLTCEPRGPVTTHAIAFGAWGGQLLSDGFERGTTSAWSYAVP